MKQPSSPELHREGFWDFGGTLNELDPPTMMEANNVRKSENFYVDLDGRRKKRPGYADASDCEPDFNFTLPIRGGFYFKDTAGNVRRVVITEKKIFIEDIGGGNFTQLYYQTTAVKKTFKPVTFESGRPIIVGFDKNLYIDTETPASPAAYQLGVDKPTSAPSVAVGAAGNLTGDYKYLVTYYKSGNFPYQSNPSVESDVVSPSSQKVDLTSIPVSSDPQVDKKRLYRTRANGAIFYWLADIDNATTSYEDNIADDSLGDEVSYERYVPPAADDVEVWDKRVWFLVSSEARIYYTNAGEEAERANLGFILVEDREPQKLVCMREYGGKLYAFKPDSMFRINKVGDSYYEPERLPFSKGCDARGSMEATKDFLIWKSPDGIELFNGYSIFEPPISMYIRKTFNSIEKSYLDKIVGFVNKNDRQYWLSVPTGTAGGPDSDPTEPDIVIVFNFVKNTFDIFKFAHQTSALFSVPKSLYVGLGGSGSHDILCGNIGGKINRYNDAFFTDAGTTISCEFLSKWYRLSKEAEWNNLREIITKYVLKNDGATKKHLTLKVYSNLDDTATLTVNLEGNDISDSLRNEVVRPTKSGVKGAYMSFGFSNAETLVGELKVIGLDGYFQTRIIKREIYGT